MLVTNPSSAAVRALALDLAATAAPGIPAPSWVSRAGTALAGACKAQTAGKLGSIGQRAILKFEEAAAITKGLGHKLEAHHLLERRHLPGLGIPDKGLPSVVLTEQEHKAMNTLLEQLLSKNAPHTKAEILSAYRQAYAAYPEWLSAVEKYLK